MNDQLTLLPDEPQWRLDERTKQVGRIGVAAARAILDEVNHREAA